MIVAIVCEEKNPKYSEISTLCSNLTKFKEDVYIINSLDGPDKADTYICIVKSENGYDLIIPEIGYSKKISLETIENDVQNAILQCFGYKKTLLIGLTVKDENGNKIKPEIEMYAPKTPIYGFPDILHYCRPLHYDQSSKLMDSKIIYSNSEILTDILQNNTLSCINGDHGFILKSVGGKIEIFFKPEISNNSLDLLLGQTVFEDFRSTIGQKRSQISNELMKFINGDHSIILSKKFKHMIRVKQEFSYMLKFVEMAPKFYDKRDDSIEQFKLFLIKEYPSEICGKYEYLEVFRQKIPQNRNKNCIRTLADLKM